MSRVETLVLLILVKMGMMKGLFRRWGNLVFVAAFIPVLAFGESLNVTVSNIPAAANRMVVVVDGGPIIGTLKANHDFPVGMSPVTLPLGVPAGGPYRVRAIAFTKDGIFPAVLRSGKATGISINSGSTANATVNMGDVSGAVDPSTPTSADPGSRVTIKVNITDPGDFLTGALSATGRIFTSTTPPTQGMTSLAGTQVSGPLLSVGNGVYSLTVSLNMPPTPTTLYYQFAESSFPFTESGQEAPFLYWPNLQSGARPLQIVPTGTISPAPLSIATVSPFPLGNVGSLYSQTIAIAGGVQPYNWSIGPGALPPGLSLSPALPAFATATLAGSPTTAGTYVFTLRVTDGAGATTSKEFSLPVVGGVTISQAGIVNAASYTAGGVAPGEIVTIFGAGVGPATLTTMQLDARGYVARTLAQTQVLFDGVAAPIIYTQAGATSVVVPYEVAGHTTTQVQLLYRAQTSNSVSIPVLASAPGIFTINASGTGTAAIINADGTVNSADHATHPGSFISLFATGEGQTNPAGVNGKPGDVPAPVPLAQPVTAVLGEMPAEVLYAGGAPGLVSGVFQVNIRIPGNAPIGSSVPILINVGGHFSQPNVTVAITK